jgi:hypothetical protein
MGDEKCAGSLKGKDYSEDLVIDEQYRNGTYENTVWGCGHWISLDYDRGLCWLL